MALVAKSDQSTKNSCFASYVLQSEELVFTLTAPYSRCVRPPGTAATMSAQAARLRARAAVGEGRKPTATLESWHASCFQACLAILRHDCDEQVPECPLLLSQRGF